MFDRSPNKYSHVLSNSKAAFHDSVTLLHAVVPHERFLFYRFERLKFSNVLYVGCVFFFFSVPAAASTDLCCLHPLAVHHLRGFTCVLWVLFTCTQNEWRYLPLFCEIQCYLKRVVLVDLHGDAILAGFQKFCQPCQHV